jgi:cytochrome c oxidase subunit II
MMKMKNLIQKLSLASMTMGVLFSSAAWAVNDLAGGPAVLQLNLQPAATKIAEEQAWLHWFMLIICTVIFVGVLG